MGYPHGLETPYLAHPNGDHPNGDHPNGELSVRYTIEIGQPKPSHLVAPSLATWDNDPNWQSCVALSPTDSGGPGNTVFMHYKNTEIVVVTGMVGQC